MLDNSASLANAGVAYVILKDWGVRGKAKGQDLRSILTHIQAALDRLSDGVGFVIVPPPIQGIGNSGGFAMQLEQRDGSFDYGKLLTTTQSVVQAANDQSALQHVITSFRTDVPQLRLHIDRTKAETLRVSVGDVFATLSAYIGSSYVNQFNKFGLALQVYVQADSPYRAHPEDILKLYVRSQDGNMVPLGALMQIEPVVGPSLISLYNLYLSSNVVGSPAQGIQLRSGDGADGADRRRAPCRRAPPMSGPACPTRRRWSAISSITRSAWRSCWSISCLAGQYESWILPLSVILAVPLALLGPVIALGAVGLDNNLYTQIGLMLLIALSAKNGILIVEVARERRMLDGEPILQAAVEASRTRFRPILMTSFAFILGVVPLVTATGAGAAARVSLGLSVFSGMIASTCLAVLFVPSFFTLLQGFEERRRARKLPAAPVVRPTALTGAAPRLIAAAGLLAMVGGPAGFAQTGFPLPSEPPAKIPSATTLPSYRTHPSLGPEAPMPAPPGAALPSMRGSGLGPESALPRPPTATLPSFRQERLPATDPARAPGRAGA